jgi:hypothetical protein
MTFPARLRCGLHSPAVPATEYASNGSAAATCVLMAPANCAELGDLRDSLHVLCAYRSLIAVPIDPLVVKSIKLMAWLRKGRSAP